MSIKVVRWLGFAPNGYTSNGFSFDLWKALEFEMNPHREVSVELLDDLGSYNSRPLIGLLVDTEKTQLEICYCEDGLTMIMEDGKLRSECFDEELCVVGESIAYTWKEAERMLAANPDRNSWAEGVVMNPVYTHVVCFEESRHIQDIAAILLLDVQVIQQSEAAKSWAAESGHSELSEVERQFFQQSEFVT